MVARNQAAAVRLRKRTLGFALVVVSLLVMPSSASTQAVYDVVAPFGVRGEGGLFPFAGLLLASDGNFYGTTVAGGSFGHGTVYKFDASGTFTPLHSFNGADGAEPFAGVSEGRDGRLYGTTRTGGASDLGTVFVLDTAGVFTSLHAFNSADGAYPFGTVLQASDGMLYGTTAAGGLGGDPGWGTVFRIDSGGALTTLHFFNFTDGATPTAGLIQRSDGNFYGTTLGGGIQHVGQGFGTVFKLDSVGTLTTLHRFSEADGSRPFAGLTEASSGILYGTTIGGGTAGYGTAFTLDASGVLTSLHSFDYLVDGARPYAALFEGRDGGLYGTTYEGGAFGTGGFGTVFRLDPSGSVTTLSVLGIRESYPFGGVVQGNNGSFYGTGTIRNGGDGARGSIFELNTAGTLTARHLFLHGNGGVTPRGELFQGSDGSFYGTTTSGGVFNMGTVFKTEAAGTLTTLHSFEGADGAVPMAGVVRRSDGTVFGTTSRGGASDGGTVFRLDAAGALTTLHTFSGADGFAPVGGLIEGRDGNLYGTTYSGGVFRKGTVFRLSPAGTLTALTHFAPDAASPAAPTGSLVEGSDGRLYGTTLRGGTNNGGTVFRVDTAGAVTVLHSFNDTYWPFAGLMQASDGSFYGTTLRGAAGSPGTIFRLDPSGTLTTLHVFDGADGTQSVGRLLEGSDGSIYGTRYLGGAFTLGTVFKLDTAGTVTTVHDFNEAGGWGPAGGVIAGSDGNLYGTASSGGPNGFGGVVFRLSVPPR